MQEILFILRSIKDGGYTKVLAPDKCHVFKIAYLKYNAMRKKFYLVNNLNSQHRMSITKKQAIYLLNVTLEYAIKNFERN